MNKLLFVCSRTTNDEHRGVIAVQDTFIIDDIDPTMDRYDCHILGELYIQSETKDLPKEEADIRAEECRYIIGAMFTFNSKDTYYRAKKALEEYYNNIKVFDNEFVELDFNFHNQ